MSTKLCVSLCELCCLFWCRYGPILKTFGRSTDTLNAMLGAIYSVWREAPDTFTVILGLLLSHGIAAPVCSVKSYAAVGYLSFGPIEQYYAFVTSACGRRTGAAARVERRRRER